MSHPKEIEYLFSYPLTAESRVVEVGAYHGGWAKEMADLYGCQIYTHEPFHEFYLLAAKNIGERKNVHLLNCAVGATERFGTIKVKGDMTGEFNGEGTTEQVKFVAIEDVLKWSCGDKCDLLALNCEGGEFEILEAMLDSGLMDKVRFFQIQFHPVVPDCEDRYRKIQDGLRLTHQPTHYDGWTWQIWERK